MFIIIIIIKIINNNFDFIRILTVLSMIKYNKNNLLFIYFSGNLYYDSKAVDITYFEHSFQMTQNDIFPSSS